MTDTTTTSTAIRAAGLDDVTALATALARAFHDDPVFAWCLPAPERRAGLLPAFFEVLARAVVPHEASEVTSDARGGALWVPQGRPPIAEEDAPAFEARLADLLGSDGDRTFALMSVLDEHLPTTDHRHLWFLGVDPRAQGQGLGSALLRSTLTGCDAAGVAAYLEATSEHNRRLYQRHGFEVVGELSADGSPSLWAMWRDPRAAG
jgi:ribosomal protein S18 acetylase RimI-like enzyme